MQAPELWHTQVQLRLARMPVHAREQVLLLALVRCVHMYLMTAREMPDQQF